MMADNYYKTNMKKESKQLQEELKRFRQINKYIDTLILEQDAPEEPAPGAVPPPPPGGDVPPPPGGDVPPPPGGDVPLDDVGGGAPPPPGGEGDVPPPPGGEGDVPPPPGGEEPLAGDVGGDGTEEIDITDLVNMTKSIKQDMDAKQSENSEVISKMDTIFSKLDDLESKLSNMDSIIDRIDQLGSKVEKMKEPTPVEKLEMRSLDSYPFNKNPEQFFQEKRGEMERSGKNYYEIKPEEISNYSKDILRNSFNPERSNEDFNY